MSGNLVTDVWVGDAGDPEAGGDSDVRRASVLLGATGLVAAGIAIAVIVIWMGLSMRV
jgi:hypothetical protein